ncbi:MAG: hypothetical protein NTX45_26935 [Proteobacteria bacterium]|nr:hypothetical protein [Pseudomonadota bacterium]
MLYQNLQYNLTSFVTPSFITPDNISSFFGYYDKCPLDSTGTRLLAHRCTFDGRNPTAEDEVEVGYYSLSDSAWHTIGKTHAFNWQQGSMLQWLGPDFESRIIYNVRRDNRFASVVFDTTTGISRELDFPVYSVHPSGRFALGVNYERFYFFRSGYNYQGVNRPEWNIPLHPDDGIFYVDIEAGSHRLLIPTVKVARFDGDLPRDHIHWLEHMIWNPSGSRFIFLHRHGTGAEYTTKLFTADGNGGNLYRFPDADLYSHTGWRSDDEFVIYAAKRNWVYQNYLRQTRKDSLWIRPVRTVMRMVRKYIFSQQTFKNIIYGYYYLLHDQTDGCVPIAAEIMREDGHMTWTKDGRYMLTDTYADEQGYRHLLIYDHQNKRLHELGLFFSPYNSCGYRCDLHPRFSRDEKHVIIDTAHADMRKVMMLRLEFNLFK